MAVPLTNSYDTNVYNITESQATEFQHDYAEEWPSICGAKRYLRRMYSDRKQICLNRVPILKWLPSYKLNYLFHDFVAGFTVGLTAIPQGIAYAVVAGLPPQYGLYSGFMGSFVYFFLGSCKDITIGPTAIISLLIQHYVAENIDLAVFIAFINGSLIFLFGLLNLGFLVQFISTPVTVGFTTAAALTIGSSQIKSLLGLKGSTSAFIPAWRNVILNIEHTQLWDTVLGTLTILLLFILKKLKYKKKIPENDDTSVWKNECRKYLCLGRNAIAVIFGTLLAYILNRNDIHPFTLTGEVASGFPDFGLPPFEITIEDQTLHFWELITHLGSSVIAIPLISILESVAVAKAFSKGKTIDATQEMLALGMCNLFGSFFQSMPTTGSFTRTAVNNASGVRTTLGGIFTGCMVLLSLGFLTGSFQYIPKSTLAAVIICAMIFMVETNEIVEIWRCKRVDIIPFITTLAACLFLSVEFGIIIGVLINVVFILYKTARPFIHVVSKKVIDHDILILSPDQSLSFSSADHFKYKTIKYAIHNSPNIIIIDGSHIQYIDSTVAKVMCTIVDDLYLLNKVVYFWNWNKETMGVLCRLKSKMSALFKDANCEEELLKTLNIETVNMSNGISLQTDKQNSLPIICS